MAIEFKSRTFTINPFNDEGLKALKEDVEILSKVDAVNFSQIVDAIKGVILAKTEKDELAIHEGMIASKLVPNLQTAISARRIINFFFKIFHEDLTKNDAPEDIAKDLVAAGIDQKNLIATERLLNLIKQETKWYADYRLKKSFRQGLFPYLQKIGTTVELRGIFNREIKSGEKTEEYAKEAKLENDYPIIPIISVAINLDSGTPDRFCFQASPEDIELLIERLRASLLKAKILEECCKK